MFFGTLVTIHYAALNLIPFVLRPFLGRTAFEALEQCGFQGGSTTAGGFD
jgi:hypothetical protein